jgi:hypothetical protein
VGPDVDAFHDGLVPEHGLRVEDVELEELVVDGRPAEAEQLATDRRARVRSNAGRNVPVRSQFGPMHYSENK